MHLLGKWEPQRGLLGKAVVRCIYEAVLLEDVLGCLILQMPYQQLNEIVS